MMNMLIGFRAGIKKLLYKEELVDEDFTRVERISLNNVTFNLTFHQQNTFVLYVYAPDVFRKIREMLGFTEEDYLKSIGPESILGNLLLGNLHTMTELVSEGKSGALFYLTHDS